MTPDGGPVLGRYAHNEAGAEEVCTVQLLGLPIALFLRAREHHDDLVREFTLMAIRQTEDPDAPALPQRLGELVEILGRRYGASVSRADTERDAAIERGDVTVDLTYAVPRSIADDLVMLTTLMDDADEFCRSEQLLTLPRDTAMVAFGHWYNGEFFNQLKGLPPTRWAGPLE